MEEINNLEASNLYGNEELYEKLCEQPSIDHCIHMPEQCIDCNMYGTFKNCPDEDSLKQFEIKLKFERIDNEMKSLINEINSVNKECKELINVINEYKRVNEEMSEP